MSSDKSFWDSLKSIWLETYFKFVRSRVPSNFKFEAVKTPWPFSFTSSFFEKVTPRTKRQIASTFTQGHKLPPPSVDFWYRPTARLNSLAEAISVLGIDKNIESSKLPNSHHFLIPTNALGKSFFSKALRVLPESYPSLEICTKRISSLFLAIWLLISRTLVLTPEYGLNTPGGSETTAYSPPSTNSLRSCLYALPLWNMMPSGTIIAALPFGFRWLTM